MEYRASLADKAVAVLAVILFVVAAYSFYYVLPAKFP